MKILYVYEFYTPHVGGGEIALQHLAEGMAAQGHTVYLVTSRIPGTAAEEVLHGVHIHRVWVPHFASRYWFILLSLGSIFKQAKSADLIHTFTYTAVPPAWLVAKLRRKKIVLTVHEFWGELWKTFSELNPLSALLHRWYERALFFLPMTQWVAISHATEKQLRQVGIPQERLNVIYQGIDQELFKPATQEKIQVVRQHMKTGSDTFVYLFFGRPGISKGLEFLLRAVPDITKKIPHSQLWLILAKEPQAQYERMIQLIQELGITSQVNVIDPVKRNMLPSYISAAQVVVVPSLSEGFGFSVAEACAVGTPVITTTVGSIPEVVNGKYILIPPASPQAIAQAVTDASYQKFSTTPAKSFSWAKTLQTYEQMYKKIL